MDRGKRNRLLTAGGCLCLFLALGAQMLARSVDGFGEWYARQIYPVWVNTIGRFWGMFPFSAGEMGIYLLIIGGVIALVRWRKDFKGLACGLFFVLSLLFFSYTFLCGINYYRLPFSYYSGLEIRERPVEELRDLCRFLTQQVNDLAEQMVVSPYYDSSLAGTQSVYIRLEATMAGKGIRALQSLSQEYEQLTGYYPRPKPVLASRVLSMQQISGIYLPFTVEANYNREVWGYNIPLTVCHELSHLKGFMREDEANFIGYLSAIGSEDLEFRYSGYLLGWIYATNALARVDRDSFVELYRQLSPVVTEDLSQNNLFWNRFDTKVAEVSTKLNDTYLKMNSQSDGVRSYDRVVDLMLADRQRKKSD